MGQVVMTHKGGGGRWLLAAGELAGDLYRGGWVLTVKRPYSFLL